MNYAILAYPLSNEYLTRFEESVCRPEYIYISELRTLPFFTMLGKLLSLKPALVFIPLEDIRIKAILPILQFIASFTRCKAIEVVFPDLRRERISFNHHCLAIAGYLRATLLSGLAAWECSRELTELAKAPRLPLFHQSLDKVMYLNANFWFGVQAGGSVGHISGIINALSQRVNQVDFISVQNNPLIKNPKTKFHPLTPPQEFAMPFELNFYQFHRMVVNQVQEFFNNSSYSFIYQRMSLGNYSGVVLSRKYKLPLILEYNGSEAWIAKNWGRPLRFHGLAEMGEEVCIQHAHLVVTISEVLVTARRCVNNAR